MEDPTNKLKGEWTFTGFEPKGCHERDPCEAYQRKIYNPEDASYEFGIYKPFKVFDKRHDITSLRACSEYEKKFQLTGTSFWSHDSVLMLPVQGEEEQVMATSSNSTPRLFKFTNDDQMLSIQTKEASCYENWSKMDMDPSDDYTIHEIPNEPSRFTEYLIKGLRNSDFPCY